MLLGVDKNFVEIKLAISLWKQVINETKLGDSHLMCWKEL